MGVINDIIEIEKKALGKAGLRYVRPDTRGYSRKRFGKGFAYYNAREERIKDKDTITRIHALKIPPAWEKVWICPDPRGHLQATGFDVKGRKQYLYHQQWGNLRNEKKFFRMIEFGNALPKIRDRVETDLRKKGLPREKVLALVIKLLEYTRIRVGNIEYMRQNNSFGLTTLRDKHIIEEGQNISISYIGKRGKEHHVHIESPRLARLVKRCKEIPGYELFQYFDTAGKRQKIDSGDVNEYLQEISGKDFTAKDFRTWSGTVHAINCLALSGPCADEKSGKKNIVAMVKDVAASLNNTVAICKKYYIHPLVIEAYLDGSLFRFIDSSRGSNNGISGHSRAEKALLKLLVSKK